MGEHILQRRGPKRWPPQFFTGEGGGCSCCTPPPPPPPPPLAAYYSPYGYAGQNFAPCKCKACSGAVWGTTSSGPGVVAADVSCRWLLEVSGVAAVTPPSPCSYANGGADCANINGSWILYPLCLSSNTAGCLICLSQPEGDPYAGNPDVYWECCLWSSIPCSPVLAFGPNPTLPECYMCMSTGVSNYVFMLWALKCFNKTTGVVVDEISYVTIQQQNISTTYFPFIWKKSSSLPCSGIADFSLVKDPYHPTVAPASANAPFCCDGVPTTIYALPLS